jgi:hypothetical protein
MHDTTHFDIELSPVMSLDVRIPIARIFGRNALQVWQASEGLPQFRASISCNQ